MLQSIKRRFLTAGRSLGRRRDRPIVTGDLELFGLSEIIQFLSMGKKTALVELSRGNYEGRIWFFEGKATHAATDTAEGEAAFFETVCWTTGSFLIDYGITSDRQTLHDDTMYLFMEGLRRIDESRNELAMEHAAETEHAVAVAETELEPEPEPEPEQEVQEYLEQEHPEYEDEELAAMTELVAQNAPLEAIELSNEMHSELYEAMDEVKQFIELDAQGFVVADATDFDPAPAPSFAPAPDPTGSTTRDSDLPPEVLALLQALDDQ